MSVPFALTPILRHAGRLLVAVALLQASPLAAQPLCRFPKPWARVGVAHGPQGPLSPLKIAADPAVIRDGSLYKMWFTNANTASQTGFAYAESTDGLAWTVHRETAPDPVMDLVLAAPDGAWDSPGIETASVVRAPDGGYLLYYSGNRVPQGSVTFAIGMATSSDGIHWTRRPAPVLEPANAWERPLCTKPGDPGTCTLGGVLEPSVVYDAAAKQYKMWYVGLGEPADSFRTYRIGYATSTDGIVWKRQPNPVFALGGPGAWDEVSTSHVEVKADPRAGYHMFYAGNSVKNYVDGAEMQHSAIGHAYSADGLTWQRDPANPILAPRPGEVDAWAAGGPSALIEGNQVKLWYFANPTSGLQSDIVLATAPCGP